MMGKLGPGARPRQRPRGLRGGDAGAGSAIALGAVTPVAAASLIGTMVTAIRTPSHLKKRLLVDRRRL